MNILRKADKIVNGQRHNAYGSWKENWGRTAALWSDYLGVKITPRQAISMMILVKLARDIHAPKTDNVLDIIGYAYGINEVTKQEGKHAVHKTSR